MMSHKDYINISHKYYDGWNDHTEIKPEFALSSGYS